MTKTDARTALGVRTIVDDANWYDHLKLMSHFVRMAGYQGLFIVWTNGQPLQAGEHHSRGRQTTSSCCEYSMIPCRDQRREWDGFSEARPNSCWTRDVGLYSYQALQSRLEENTFATAGLVDYSGPVLRLANLSQVDFYVLLIRLRNVYAGGDPTNYLLPDEALRLFMVHCSRRIGDAYFRTRGTRSRSSSTSWPYWSRIPGGLGSPPRWHRNQARD